MPNKRDDYDTPHYGEPSRRDDRTARDAGYRGGYLGVGGRVRSAIHNPYRDYFGRVVVLGGTMSDRRSKRRAEDMAEMVGGVREVRSNLRITR